MASTEGEPDRITDPALLHILEQLKKREPIFHRPELGTSRRDFESMVTEDFWEIGASGRRYSRSHVLDELQKRHATIHDDVWHASDFHLRQLSDDTFLLTYTLLQDQKRLTRRSTIWQRTTHEWKIVFHQGTIVESVDLPA